MTEQDLLAAHQVDGNDRIIEEAYDISCVICDVGWYSICMIVMAIQMHRLFYQIPISVEYAMLSAILK